jgi:hypothetical protein
VKMEPTRCPETSVKNYHTTRRNIPEESRSRQHRGGSLKSKLACSWTSYDLQAGEMQRRRIPRRGHELGRPLRNQGEP